MFSPQDTFMARIIVNKGMFSPAAALAFNVTGKLVQLRNGWAQTGAVSASREWEKDGLGARKNWIQIPGLPLPGCVDLGISLNLCFSSVTWDCYFLGYYKDLRRLEALALGRYLIHGSRSYLCCLSKLRCHLLQDAAWTVLDKLSLSFLLQQYFLPSLYSITYYTVL